MPPFYDISVDTMRDGEKKEDPSSRVRPMSERFVNTGSGPLTPGLNRRRHASFSTNDEMLKIAVGNKAHDLEISVEELEEMEANEPAKPLLVAVLPDSPRSPRYDANDHGGFLKVLLASALLLIMLYTLSIATYKSPEGASKAIVKESLHELSSLSENAVEAGAADEAEGTTDKLADAITTELRKQIQKEVQKQLRGYDHKMFD